MRTTGIWTWAPAALAGALLCGLAACSAHHVPVPSVVGISNPPATRAENLERLARLHERRTAGEDDREYVLGAGDVLTLKAFDFDDMNRRVRIDGEGKINLPLLESVTVGGLTLAEVQRELTARLGEYMYDPYVTVFVEEYRSQQVAVVGAVKRPGLVTLTTRDSTVLDAISAAGGMDAQAGGRIYLIPGEGRSRRETATLAEALHSGTAAIEATGLEPQGDLYAEMPPIMLDSKEVPQGVESFFFSLPVRPGDVIMVPRNGDFIVQGWVARPGSHPLSSGMTLRGALATVGGLTFPAASNRIRIYRLDANGETEMQQVNYADILRHKAADVFIHEGDVIEVASSSAKLVPYGFYKVMVDIMRVGARIRVAP